LKLLNSNGVEYLVIGGIAVGYHGYPRATGALDIWVRQSPDNADRLVKALRDFGFSGADVRRERILEQDAMLRMGFPPVRIEVLTAISGVEFGDCYPRRVQAMLDGVPVDLISLADIKRNKAASGRLKDRNDLENLP
jgi:hypothetical protein